MKRLAVGLFLTAALPLYGQVPYGQEREVLTSDRVVLYSGLAFDLATTEVALGRGYREGNPILGQNRTRRITTALSLTVMADVLTRRWIESEHPKAARIIRYVAGSVHIGAGAWNLSGGRPRDGSRTTNR